MFKKLLRLSGQAILLVAVVAVISAWPSLHWGGSKNFQALIAAGIITLIAGIVGLVPITIAVQHKADWLGQACLGATVIRLLVTLSAGMGWYLAIKPPLMAFALWVMLFYLVLLAWETKMAMGFVKTVYGQKSKRVDE